MFDLAALRSYLGEGTGTIPDAQLTPHVDAARAQYQQRTGRHLAAGSSALLHEVREATYLIRLPPQVTAVTAVTRDGEAVDAADYQLVNAQLRRRDGWPFGVYEITYSHAGDEVTFAALVESILLRLGAHSWRSRRQVRPPSIDGEAAPDGRLPFDLYKDLQQLRNRIVG